MVVAYDFLWSFLRIFKDSLFEGYILRYSVGLIINLSDFYKSLYVLEFFKWKVFGWRVPQRCFISFYVSFSFFIPVLYTRHCVLSLFKDNTLSLFNQDSTVDTSSGSLLGHVFLSPEVLLTKVPPFFLWWKYRFIEFKILKNLLNSYLITICSSFDSFTFSLRQLRSFLFQRTFSSLIVSCDVPSGRW